MKIGFIGLGIMGKPMAKNLLKAGYTDLLVNNRSQAPVQELEAAGATGATQQEIGAQCDVVITMLPNSPQVKEVMLGENGVASHMKPGAVFIDCSSINPVASKEIYAALQKKGVEMLDAPVSGGEPKAIDGTLSFMVGGKQEVFDAYKPVLDAMGASTVRCGEVGAGNTTKLANQIIVACNIQALAEALTLAQKAGVDPELVFQAIKGGLAGSTVMNAKAPMMIAGNDKPGFKIDLHIKDLNNVLDCAHAVGAPVLLYNNPGRVGYTMSAKLVEELAHNVPNIVGMKDTSGDITQTSEFIRRTRDVGFKVFGGKDTLLYASLCHGAVGGVCTAANFMPELITDVYNKFAAGDRTGSLEAQFKLNPVRLSMDAASFPVAAKDMANLRGRKVGVPYLPTLPTPEGAAKQGFVTTMTEAGLL